MAGYFVAGVGVDLIAIISCAITVTITTGITAGYVGLILGCRSGSIGGFGFGAGTGELDRIAVAIHGIGP